MKKVVLIFMACLMICLSGCSFDMLTSGKLKSEEEFFAENEYNDISQAPVSADLAKYSGTWYGYGTDSTSAVTSERKLTFISESKFKLNDEVFVLIGEDTAESVEDHDSAEGTNDCKIILNFGKDSNGERALESYMIKKASRKQISESMCYYRQTSRENYQDFKKGLLIEQADTTASESKPEPKPQPKTQSEPEPKKTPAPDPVNYAKLGFQQRYDILSGRSIPEGPQTQMNIESAELFEEWDMLLNEVYQYLKKTKSSYEFQIIKKDEIQWIKEKEAAIKKNRSEYEGGTMAPMVANMTGIEYTQRRCSYLISLID